MADALRVVDGLVSPLGRGATRLRGQLQGGETVAFQVLKALPQDHYLVSIKQQRLTVLSRLPLEVGGSYLAEVVLREGGTINLLFRSTVPSLLEGLIAQRQDYQMPMTVLMKKFLPHVPEASVLRADCSSAETVKQALRACGTFYETRLKEFLKTGKSFPFLEDLKGLLLEIAGRKGAPGGLQETVAATLKNLEYQQLLSSQSGPDGPVFFWLPFLDDRLVEGFVKRSRGQKESRFLVTLRVPFPDSEELLVTLEWKPGRIGVHFACGPRAYSLLSSEASTLEEQIRRLGKMQININVSKGLPRHLREELKGIRFLESYG